MITKCLSLVPYVAVPSAQRYWERQMRASTACPAHWTEGAVARTNVERPNCRRDQESASAGGL